MRGWRWAVLVALLSMAAVGPARAQTPVELAKRWGLLGTWALDCKVAASDALPWLSYAVHNGALFVDRDYGTHQETSINRVMSARLLPDETIETVILFSALKPPQTRLNVHAKNAGGAVRAMVSKNVDTDEFSIKGGVLTANGQPSKWQYRCR